MRLTLRYLLAYMDEQLEPADAEEVAAKLEKSEYAKSLLHRIRDVTRRLRLGAPRLDARGMGFDANTVAEYLDNALPDDRVPDFEKICLESDMHLAEVAACHQILSLVLGEPAQVDPASRKRMYALAANPPTRVDQPSLPPRPKSAQDRRARTKRKKHKVPEYLKEPEQPRFRRRVVGVLALLLLAAAALLVLLGPARIWRWTSGRPGAAQAEGKVDQVAKSSPMAAGDKRPAVQDKPAAKKARRPAKSTPQQRDKSKSGARRTDSQPERGPLDQPSGAARQPRASEEQPPQPPQPEQQAAEPAEQMPAQRADTEEGTDSQPAGAEEPVAPPAADATTPEPPEAQAVPAAVPDEDVDVAANINLGRSILERDVLLRWRPEATEQASGAWVRLADRAPIYAGDMLLVLPNYDPNLTLEAVTVQALGPTRMELLAPDEAGTVGIRLVSGRITVWPNGRPGARLRMVAGDYQGTLILDDPDATAGIEVQRSLRWGVDPRQEPPQVVADLYANHGDISWQTPDGQVTPLSSPGKLPLGGHSQPAIAPPAAAGAAAAANAGEGGGKPLPPWMIGFVLSPHDKRAADSVEHHLSRPDRPVSLGLREMFSDRRVEVRLLAMQCLAEIGEFDVFPAIFNDPNHRALWAKALETLRAQLALSPQTAVAVSDAFARARGPRAPALFRMLYGYSDEQLAAGAAAELVSTLDHEDLDARVLAYLNLREITGASHYYEPHGNQKKREQSVRTWRERLEKGDVVRKTARP